MDTIAQARRWVREAANIITSDIKQHFTIQEIALKVGTNTFSLKRGFSEEYGMGLYEYLVLARLKKTEELLLETDAPIKVIAKQVGYKSASSLIAVFRKKNGVSPVIWKRLEKAKLLLEKDHKSHADIARISGFANEESFTSLFTKKFGVPPEEWKAVTSG